MFFVFVAAGLGLLSLAHIAPFPFLIEAVAPTRALWRMPSSPGQPTVYLTFDDGPNPTATPELLDVLEREEAVATFFLINRHITEDTAPIVKRIFDEGHAVGLHSHTRGLMALAPETLARTLTDDADRIEQLAGQRPCRVFRPHAGWRSGLMFQGLARIDHVLVGWGWGLWDFNWYRQPAPSSLASRLAARVSDGGIIVIHDGHHQNPRADRRYAVAATSQLVPALRDRGFQLGRICP